MANSALRSPQVAAGAGVYVKEGVTYANSGHPAEGRLTLATATPVMVSDVSNSTSIFYTPYTGNHIALYDGTDWVLHEFSELTNTTTNATVNPAAVGNNLNYDLFVWNNNGTLALGRGPAWTGDTTRGTGAGTTELERVDGVWVNKIAITNGAAAQRGRYVGTVRSDGAAGIDWELGGDAAGGDPIFLYVWNMYNRIPVSATCRDSSDTWTYTTATYRSRNNSTSNRASFVIGLNELPVSATLMAAVTNSGAGISHNNAIGLDSTTAHSGLTALQNSMVGGNYLATGAIFNGFPGLGLHFLQTLERSGASGTTTWAGDAGVNDFLTGFVFNGMF